MFREPCKKTQIVFHIRNSSEILLNIPTFQPLCKNIRAEFAAAIKSAKNANTFSKVRYAEVSSNISQKYNSIMEALSLCEKGNFQSTISSSKFVSSPRTKSLRDT